MTINHAQPIVRACIRCEFFKSNTPITGECRISRPYLGDSRHLRVWPIVCNDDWCGDFKQASDENVEQRLMEQNHRDI